MGDDDSRRVARSFAAECAAAIGPELRAVLLHAADGQPAGTRRHPASIVLVVATTTSAILKRVAALAARWRRSGIATPLVLDDAYLHTSCDVFPLEILSLMDSHELLSGERDPLAGLELDHEHLRLEIEQQLKGKLLHLRQAYLGLGGRSRQLHALMLDSSMGFETIMRGLLLVAGRPRGRASEDLSSEVERALGVRLDAFRRIQAARRSGRNPAAGDAEALFFSYLDELTVLARVADSITRPENR